MTNKKKTSRTGWAALVVLVAGLVGLVVWALPPGQDSVVDSDAAHALEATGTPGLDDARAAAKQRKAGALERLPESTCELAILTDKTDAQLKAIEATSLVDPKWCGAACDRVKALAADKERVELEVTKADDYILPPKESYETVAPTLTPAEREQIEKRTALLVVKVHAKTDNTQIAARTCFALSAAAATSLGDAFVYDEAGRKIETAAQFREKVITSAADQPAFVPKHVSIQIYKSDDGAARLTTHGMIRFGSPDFVVRGVSMGEGNAVANVVNAVAAKATAIQADLPFTITLTDVARITGRSPNRLVADPETSKPLVLEVVEAERVEGDADNDLVELVPPGGSVPEAWSEALAALFGEHAQIVATGMDKELEGAAVEARASMPRAIERFQAGEGTLLVKGPFTIPTRDGGVEWMWIDALSCNAKACAGTLTNSPGYATNLAAGKTTVVDREKTVDWLLRFRDGGTTGGSSIEILEARSRTALKRR